MYVYLERYAYTHRGGVCAQSIAIALCHTRSSISKVASAIDVYICLYVYLS